MVKLDHPINRLSGQKLHFSPRQKQTFTFLQGKWKGMYSAVLHSRGSTVGIWMRMDAGLLTSFFDVATLSLSRQKLCVGFEREHLYTQVRKGALVHTGLRIFWLRFC